ncbi:hypothetical protein BP5796_01853 [Coleophoma crateriformis]|uniref:Uncharacterized protein n=1 Tax=Coleophoma crateriformis TaxID=565419 RepID=A0A3D8T1T5_9HELO|nr:hypothetical protein BP5796_01853 [Coleophoma crateriformis]
MPPPSPSHDSILSQSTACEFTSTRINQERREEAAKKTKTKTKKKKKHQPRNNQAPPVSPHQKNNSPLPSPPSRKSSSIPPGNQPTTSIGKYRVCIGDSLDAQEAEQKRGSDPQPVRT